MTKFQDIPSGEKRLLQMQLGAMARLLARPDPDPEVVRDTARACLLGLVKYAGEGEPGDSSQTSDQG